MNTHLVEATGFEGGTKELNPFNYKGFSVCVPP